MGFHGVFPALGGLGYLLWAQHGRLLLALECGSPDGSMLEHPPAARTTVPWICDQQHTRRGPGGVTPWLSDHSQTRAFHAFINYVLLSKYPSLCSPCQCPVSQMDGSSSWTTCQKQARPQQPSMKPTNTGVSGCFYFWLCYYALRAFPCMLSWSPACSWCKGTSLQGLLKCPPKQQSMKFLHPSQGLPQTVGKGLRGKIAQASFNERPPLPFISAMGQSELLR